MNERRHQPAKVTEFDANGQPIKRQTVALHGETEVQTAQASKKTSHDNAPAVTLGEGLQSTLTARIRPTPEQAAQAGRFKEQLGPKLAQLGMGEQQINTLAAAAAKEQARFAVQGEVQAFYLSKDGSTIAMRQAWPPLREFNVASASNQSEMAHLLEARAMVEPQAQSQDAVYPVSNRQVEQKTRTA